MQSLLSNTSTRSKILGGFFIVIFINIIILTISVNSMRNSQLAATEIKHLMTTAFINLTRVQNDFMEANLKFASGLNKDDQSYTADQLRSEARTLISKIEAAAAKVNPNRLGNNQAYIENGTKLKEHADIIINKLNTVVMPLLQGDEVKRGSSNIYTREIVPHLAVVFECAVNLSTLLTQRNIALSSPAADPFEIYLNLILATIATVIAFIIAFTISNYIAKQIDVTVKDIKRMESGDFNFEITAEGKDEFSVVRRSLDSMLHSLNNILNMTKHECNRLQDEMRSVYNETQHISSTSSDIQNQSITVATAADEMVSTTANIARSCESAAQGSNLCKEITASGVKKVQDAFDNVQVQVEHTKDNASKIESLANQTNAIGSIVSTIDDIAAQTNLLALNAAIEAARAGEAGRGFAVVADEVRALASRTTQSTQEISKMVNTIQTEANLASESIKASVENMDNVAQDAKDLEQLLLDITEHVNEVNNQITQIATSAEEQTTATSEISANATSVSDVSKEMTQSSEEQSISVESSIQDLNKLTEALNFFKTR